tara:strand:- start:329 stop:688 length:360 start_codon:yes stop_codon:yes gene_type:complete
MREGWSDTKSAYKNGYTLGMSEENTKEQMSVVDRIKANRAAIKAAGGFSKWKKPLKAKAKAKSDKDFKKYNEMKKQGNPNKGPNSAEFSADNKKIMDEMRKQDRAERRQEWDEENAKDD